LEDRTDPNRTDQTGLIQSQIFPFSCGIEEDVGGHESDQTGLIFPVLCDILRAAAGRHCQLKSSTKVPQERVSKMHQLFNCYD